MSKGLAYHSILAATALGLIAAGTLVLSPPAFATNPIIPGNESDVGVYTDGTSHVSDIGDPTYSNASTVEALLDPGVAWTADSMNDSIFADDLARYDDRVAAGQAPFYLDRVLGVTGDNSGLRILQTRGRSLYVRGSSTTNFNVLGFGGSSYAGGAAAVGTLYTVTVPGSTITETTAQRFNAPSYESGRFTMGSNITIDQKKFITYNNVAVTTLKLNNTSGSDQTFTMRMAGVATSATDQPDELIGTKPLSDGGGNLSVTGTWATATIKFKAPGFTVNGTNLERSVTVPAGGSTELLVAAALYYDSLPDTPVELDEYTSLTPAAAFKRGTTEFNERWAADIPYIDTPSPAIEKAILYRWWGERYNSLDANVPGYTYQYPVTIEGVNLYQNAIVLTQPMHLQDTKWIRNPYLGYGQILNVGELSGSSAFLDSPGHSSWNNHYSQYIGTAGLEAYYVHGGGAEIAQRFAEYFEGDGVGQLEHYDGNGNNLIAYTANYMPGNDADALTFGYPKAGTSAAGSSNIERPESAYVWGDFDAAAKLYQVAGAPQSKVDAMTAKADDIKDAILNELWSPTMRMFVTATTRGRTAATTSGGNTNPLAATEPTHIPARESNLYDIYAQNLIDPADYATYVDGFRFLTYGDNSPIFPFYTANQYDRTRYNIGGSNNFSNINFTVQYRGVRSALRYYDPEQKYITPEYTAQLLDWMAWSIYLNSGDLRYANQAEYYSGWSASAKTYSRNNPYHVMLGNMNYIFIEDMGGMQTRADDVIELWPIDLGYDYFMVNNLRYHGHDVTIVWDEDGTRYGMGQGYSLYLDGDKKVTSSTLGRLTYDPNTNTVTPGDGATITFTAATGATFPTAVNTPIEDDRVIEYLKTAGIDLTSSQPNLAKGATVSSSTMQTAIPSDSRAAFHTPGSSTSAMNYDPGSISARHRTASLAAVTDGNTVNEPYWGNYNVAAQDGWIELDFGSDQTFDNVQVYFADTDYDGGQKPPAKYNIQVWSADQSAWVPISGQARIPVKPQGKLNEALFPAVTADKVRVAFTNADGAWTAITEIQVFNSGREVPVVENQAPVVTASVDATKAGNLSTEVVATVTDDGIPETGQLTTNWAVTQAPAGATTVITDPSALRTRITGSVEGEYELTFTASDGELTTTRTVNVTLARVSTSVEHGASATITTTCTASWENHNRVNLASNPTSSNPGTGNGWGNWGCTNNGTSSSRAAWIQYTWTQPVTMTGTSIYWYDDNGGTRMPTATTYAIEYSLDGTTWTAVTFTGTSSYANGVVRSAWNHFTFESVTAQYLRIRVWGVQGSGAGTGVLRWRVNGPTVESIDSPIDIRTAVGTIPVLPSTLPGLYSDGSPASVPVTWTPITAEDVAEQNVEGQPLVVYGVNESFGLLVEARIHIRPADQTVVISAVTDPSQTIWVGTPIALPATARVHFNDGSDDSVSIGITWDAYDPDIINVQGVHTIAGTLVLPDWVLDVGVPPITFTLTVEGPMETAELAAAIDQAAGLEYDEYTTSSWEALAEAVAAGEAALENLAGLDQDGVDALTAAIMQAIDDLAARGDTTLLAAVVSAFESLDLTPYTNASAAELQQAIADAEAMVADNSDASQAQVDAQVSLIQAKVAALQPKTGDDLVDSRTLAAIVEVAVSLDPDEYTSASYAVLAARLASAQEVLADPEATQVQVDTATQALSLSIEALVPASKTPYKKVGTATISGTAKVGKTLTAKPGTWSPKAASYGYQWYRDGERIPGATDVTYLLTAADMGHKITVKSRAQKVDYAETWSHASKEKKVAAGSLTTKTAIVTNQTTGKDPAKTAPKFGETLQVIPGEWGPAGVTLTYQWYRSGKVVAGATSDTYTLGVDDLGKKLKVKVSGALDGYKDASKTSKQSKAVAKLTFTAQTPAVMGTAMVGQTMVIDLGTWSPVPDSLTYQWYRSGKAIKDATASTYQLVAADKGKYITVKVTGASVGYATLSKTSAKTAKVVG
ncbi:MAG: discoidin domain-containing protein [Propionibacteriaceae bacterium]|jgi:hypothetical protein|nr:discoidin domain-containing protein [Propionibacteriaceae bacterium]